ncbi:MAG: hypothetical protein ACRC0A_05345 [Chitinophagaceae bacterium]
MDSCFVLTWNRKKSYRTITKSLHDGKTWTEHKSSRKLLPKSIYMASLINVKAEDNILNQDILIFSNPSTTKGQHSITIKISLDKGNTSGHLNIKYY